MMREFVGFGAYEAACKLDEGLQGWNLLLLVFSLICLTVRFSGLFKMVF